MLAFCFVIKVLYPVLGLSLTLFFFIIFVASLLTSGTTATVALLRDGIELVVASVGDSRAILCRKGKPMKLTIDHTPERKDEKERYHYPYLLITWG